MNSSLTAVALSETARLYRQPLAWVILALGTGLLAIFYLLLIVRFIDAAPELRQAGVTVEIMMRYFAVATLAILLLTPILTMGCIAGDRRDGMLRFLYSTPLNSAAIVLGKLLAQLVFAFTYVLLVVLMPLTLLWGAEIDLGVYLTNVIGLVLFTLMHNCLGVMASALTRIPVASALIALLMSLVLWLAQWADRLDPQASTIGGWSTMTRLRGFAQGLVVSGDVVYFCVASVLFVTIAVLVVIADRRLA